MSSEVQTTSTALTLPQRAALALKSAEVEKNLMELAAKSTSITVITNSDGYKQVHSARMTLKAQRVEIQKRAKVAREDSTAFSKAIIAEENRLVGIIDPEETRLAAIQKAHDDKVEAERQAKAEAERKRVGAIQAQLEIIRGMPLRAAGKSAEVALSVLTEAQALAIGDGFAEFKEAADGAIKASIITLQAIYDERLNHEAEQERLRLERIELDRQKAEAAERDRLAQREREAEVNRQRVAREANEALILKQQEEAAAELQRQRDEQAQREAAERIRRVEEDAAAQKIRDAEAKKLADDRALFEAEQAKIAGEKRMEELVKAEQARLAAIHRPSYESIVTAIGDYYLVPNEKAAQWLGEIFSERSKLLAMQGERT